MAKKKNKILILLAHPVLYKSRINKQLIEAISGLEDVEIHNLYEEYPDFHIDIQREQKLLLKHDIIIWQHPFYWYSAPAILKEWTDLVLQHNFAYGRKGIALAEKYVMSVITVGGQHQAYRENGFNMFTIRQFLSPYEQTVRLCKMYYLPPFVVHGTHLINDSEMKVYIHHYKTLIVLLRDNVFDMNQYMKFEYINHFISELENK